MKADAMVIQSLMNRKPSISIGVLAAILIGCVFADLIAAKDPSYMDLANCSREPCGEFLFGTDSLGRDIFSGIWHGGRVSIFIGFLSAAVSGFIGIAYGTASGLAPKWLDLLMMRFIEIMLSIPELLLVIFVQALLGEAGIVSISVVIGITGWAPVAKVVRTEVIQLRETGYVIASRCMGGGFFHILFRHLIPNFIPAIMFMLIMSIRSAIVSESTLSFMGIGLPLEIISWGSMLSLAGDALMTGAWWVIIIPGTFLAAFLLSITNIGDWILSRNS